MIARIGNMQDQTGKPGPREIAYCPTCHEEYSANRGDYFFLKATDVLYCEACGEPLQLVTKQTVYSKAKR